LVLCFTWIAFSFFFPIVFAAFGRFHPFTKTFQHFGRILALNFATPDTRLNALANRFHVRTATGAIGGFASIGIIGQNRDAKDHSQRCQACADVVFHFFLVCFHQIIVFCPLGNRRRLIHVVTPHLNFPANLSPRQTNSAVF
jgi:hypothetical protein